jgi:glutamyl/glutaminyl-tRNA synthetase
MLNFLSLLGWSPGNDRELFTRDELVEAFALEGISGGNGVFNPEKLDWFGLQHMMRLAPDELAVRLKPVLADAGLWNDDYLSNRHAWFFSVIELLKPRSRTLNEFVTQGRFFFTDEVEYDAAAVDKHLRGEGMRHHLQALDALFAELPTFDPQSLETGIRGLAESRGVKAGSLIHAMRVTATGKSVSPGVFETLSLIGRERVRARVATAVELVSAARA